MSDNSSNNTKLPETEGEKVKLLRIPPARVKTILKSDPDFNQILSNEALLLVSRATELFCESLAREAYSYTAQSKKKTLQKRDIEVAIDGVDSLAFLEGINL